MMIDLIGENNGNELGDAGKDQISMQGLFVLGAASCKAEILLDVVDIPFNSSPDFVSVIPFVSSADRSGISTKIFFRIDINHTATS